MKVNLRRGLTLIELVVVLLILAATAGILVPRLIGYTGRAHGATGASNIAEITKAIALFETNNGAQPNNWDSLIVNGTGIYGPLVEGTVFPVVAGTLTTAEVDALDAAGITNVVDMSGTPANATFAPNAGASRAIDDTANNIALLSGTASATTTNAIGDLGLDAAGRYVAFGLGSNSNMIGSVITDAPVHFPEGGENPEDVYLRWFVVYQVGDGGGTFERARFTGVFACEPESGEMTNLGTHLGEYFENRDS